MKKKMTKNIQILMQALDAMGMDAAKSYFFARELESIRKQMLKVVYPEGSKAFKLFPVNTDSSKFDAEFVYRNEDTVGQAEWVTQGAGDYPDIAAFSSEETSKIHTAGASYTVTQDDIDRSVAVGRPLSRTNAERARNAIMRKLDAAAATGSTELGLEGFCNSTAVTEAIVGNGAGGTPQWSTKTADEIILDLNTLVGHITVQGVEEYMPDTIILPHDKYGKIADTPRSSVSDTSILKWFLNNSPWIKNIEPWVKMTGIAAGTTDRMMAFKRHPDILEWSIPITFEQFKPINLGDGFKVKCRGKTTGAIIHHPKACRYAYSI